MAFASIDPHTGSHIARHASLSAAECASVLTAARETYQTWRYLDVTVRCGVIKRLAEWLRQDHDRHARLISSEMGKPLVEARAEVEKCAWLCEQVTKQAPIALAAEDVISDAQCSYVAYLPLGAILAIMPWNYPYWQVFRAVVGAIAAGNVVLLKHAPNVQGCAAAITQLFRDAGAPPGLLQNLPVETKLVAELIADPVIAGVTLTGSTAAGSAVAALAGKHLKPCVLELGGSDPYVILEDANLDQAVQACITARFHNAGQSCIAAKRVIAVDSVYDAVQQRLLTEIESLRWGDPLDPETDLGPMARTDLREALHQQIAASTDLGAALLCGGYIPSGTACFYPPTFLAGVKPGMPAFDEELFGPALALIRADDEDDAIALANRTSYGLGAAIFTERVAHAESLCYYDLEAGSTFVNGHVRSDPRLPFGGIKNSGWGRELAMAGIRQFCNVKTIYVQ
ncbi:MAG: NAD-dependent succinate-semialdehyde dehydrogenase [Planctomycetota bacterium]|jgi:succinate-semialdehyde dehydrogenase/glutarate-semialdehyde dehydrogenase|nr:NAD-dependent succinate-semialdehyde dehydrogenase [Planctomycetota bacterium]